MEAEEREYVEYDQANNKELQQTQLPAVPVVSTNVSGGDLERRLAALKLRGTSRPPPTESTPVPRIHDIKSTIVPSTALSRSPPKVYCREIVWCV